MKMNTLSRQLLQRLLLFSLFNLPPLRFDSSRGTRNMVLIFSFLWPPFAWVRLKVVYCPRVIASIRLLGWGHGEATCKAMVFSS